MQYPRLYSLLQIIFAKSLCKITTYAYHLRLLSDKFPKDVHLLFDVKNSFSGP